MYLSEKKRIRLRANYNRWRIKNLEKARQNSRIWAENNKDKIKLGWERWRIKHEFDLDQFSRNYYSKNAEKIKAYVKQWRFKNMDKVRIYRKLYKFRKRSAGRLKPYDLVKIYDLNILKYGFLTCELCYLKIEEPAFAFDHKIPLSRGGKNAVSNIWITHKSCNNRKHTKTVEEFFEKERLN